MKARDNYFDNRIITECNMNDKRKSEKRDGCRRFLWHQIDAHKFDLSPNQKDYIYLSFDDIVHSYRLSILIIYTSHHSLTSFPSFILWLPVAPKKPQCPSPSLCHDGITTPVDDSSIVNLKVLCCPINKV